MYSIDIPAAERTGPLPAACLQVSEGETFTTYQHSGWKEVVDVETKRAHDNAEDVLI
jgi:hypothetical protein